MGCDTFLSEEQYLKPKAYSISFDELLEYAVRGWVHLVKSCPGYQPQEFCQWLKWSGKFIYLKKGSKWTHTPPPHPPFSFCCCCNTLFLHDFQNPKWPCHFIQLSWASWSACFPRRPKFKYLSQNSGFLRTGLLSFPVEKPSAVVQVHITGAPWGTSGYSMFWRWLTQSRGKGGEGVFISTVANFPNEGPNYSTSTLSLLPESTISVCQ